LPARASNIQKNDFPGENVGGSKSMTKETLGDVIMSSKGELYRISKTLLRSDADCHDAISETIVKSFDNLYTLKDERYVKTWLIRILINECYMIIRRSKKIIPYKDVPYTPVNEKENSEIYDAISSLPDDEKLCIVLHYIEGYKVREIVEMTKLTENIVKKRLVTARNHLRERLDAKECG